MKKNYSKPTVKTVIVGNNVLLSGSDVRVYDSNADENAEVLSKGAGIWDNCWENEEE